MYSLSFKNRIASYYIITTALLIFVVYFTIYSIVKYNVYSDVNNDIMIEVENHLSEITTVNDKIQLVDEEEWKEIEHNTLGVNPVFVQFTDVNKKLIEKSPNLKKQQLTFNDNATDNELFDSKLVDIVIRQIQVPLYRNSKLIGYLVIAMSLEDSLIVIDNLFKILYISFPLILLILFIIARFIVGKSIKPINEIIATSNLITSENLSGRMVLPKNKDELYVLSNTINNLLNRIENAVEREKQFTSYASHELRTPLSVIKGTLEVLIRKPRTENEYHEKINYCINEVDRLNILVDELLILARFENEKSEIKSEKVELNSIILETLTQFSKKIESKNIKIIHNFQENCSVISDSHLVSIIFNNIVSNAIKYSFENGKIEIDLYEENNAVICKISDEGIGIQSSDIHKIYEPFFRSNDQNTNKGNGLGLAIVKRLSELININVNIENNLNKGISVFLTFKN